MKAKLAKFQISVLSFLCVVIVALIGLLYGSISLGSLTFQFVFPAVFLVGVFITTAGVIVIIMPVRVSQKDSNLIDHTTYFSATMEKREKKRKTARDTLWMGIGVITIAAIIQWVLSLVL